MLGQKREKDRRAVKAQADASPHDARPRSGEKPGLNDIIAHMLDDPLDVAKGN